MVNKLILGTAQFGMPYGINNSLGQPSKDVVFSILNYAYSNGIRLLDTANSYGNSIDLLSEYHANNSNKFDIISKFHLHGKQQELTIQKELNYLKINSFDSYLFHSFKNYEECTPLIFDQLLEFKAKGQIRKIGVSLYTNNQFQLAANDSRIDLIQFPYNLLDNYNQRSESMILAKKNKKELHIRSVFLQGLFFKKGSEFPEKLKPLSSYIEQLEIIRKQNNVSFQQLALAYVGSSPFIDKVLIGIDTLTQLKTNIEDCKIQLSDACISQVNAIHVNEVELLNPVNWN